MLKNKNSIKIRERVIKFMMSYGWIILAVVIASVLIYLRPTDFLAPSFKLSSENVTPILNYSSKVDCDALLSFEVRNNEQFVQNLSVQITLSFLVLHCVELENQVKLQKFEINRSLYKNSFCVKINNMTYGYCT